jgi:DNA-binding response OmpR family regulator
MFNVLLVEDTQEIQYLVGVALDKECKVEYAPNLKDARTKMDQSRFDLILLDLFLPDGHGYQFAQYSKELSPQAPIIFLTSDSTDESQIVGFQLGAVDYITKPFNPQVLKARVLAKLKHDPAKAGLKLEVGPFVLDPQTLTCTVTQNGQVSSVALSSLEYKILNFLFRNSSKIVTRTQLIDQVWSPGIHIQDRSVDQHIRSLRKKIPLLREYVKSVYGEGYMFAKDKIK